MFDFGTIIFLEGSISKFLIAYKKKYFYLYFPFRNVITAALRFSKNLIQIIISKSCCNYDLIYMIKNRITHIGVEQRTE